MNETTNAVLTGVREVSGLELRLERAQRVATEAVQLLRSAVASADPGRVVSLLDEVDDFFALLDAVEATVRMAHESVRLADAEELAEDAYHLALAARREARYRASRMRPS